MYYGRCQVMFRKNLQSLYFLQVYASTTDSCLAEAIANFAEIHDNGLLKGIVVILYYLVDFPANYGP